MTDSRPPRVKPKNTEIAALAAMLVVRMRTTQHGTAESVASPYHFDAYEWLTLLDRCLDKALAFQHVEAVDDLVALVVNGILKEDGEQTGPAAG